MLAARLWTTFSVLVLTDSPSLRGVVQAAWILGIPSISTRHIRHWPTTESRGWKQKWGISMPASLAASIRLTSFGHLDRPAVEEHGEGVLLGSRGRRLRRGGAHAVTSPRRGRARAREAAVSVRRGAGTRPGTSPPRRAPARSRRRRRRRWSCRCPSCWRSRSSRSRSSRRPSPASMRRRILWSQGVPSRQGVHWPHDSCAKNFARFAAASTMQVSSFMTMIAAEPSMDFFAARPSKSSGQSSISSAVSIAAEAPPGMTALTLAAVPHPAAEVLAEDQLLHAGGPSAPRTRPGRLTWPERQ